MTELTAEHIIKVPTPELKAGDEYWGDVLPGDANEVEVVGTSMFYRLEEGPLPPQRRPSWVVWRVYWADGGFSIRQWTRNRTLTVRRAHD